MNKKITLHPYNKKGQIVEDTNLYPKCRIDGLVDKDGHAISINPPFSSIRKISDFLYETECDYLDYELGKSLIEEYYEPIPFGCSSFRKGNIYGRNLDWYYNNDVDFIVKTKANSNRYAAIGVASAVIGLDKEKVEKGDYRDIIYYMMPFSLVDGINEKGVFVNVNVINSESHTTGTLPLIEERERLCMTMLPRYILDNFASATEAIDYIKNYVSVYANAKVAEKGFEAHFMIGDSTKTYIMEFVENEIVTLENDILTNFMLNDVIFNADGKVYTPINLPAHSAAENHIQPFGQGLERYNLIVDNQSSVNNIETMCELFSETLNYKKTYDGTLSVADVWYTEFTGINDLTVTSPFTDFTTTLNNARNLFNHRSREKDDPNFGTWHTTHTSVYDLNQKTLYMYDSTEDGLLHIFSLDSNTLKLPSETLNENIIVGVNTDKKQIQVKIGDGLKISDATLSVKTPLYKHTINGTVELITTDKESYEWDNINNAALISGRYISGRYYDENLGTIYSIIALKDGTSHSSSTIHLQGIYYYNGAVIQVLTFSQSTFVDVVTIL